MSRVQKLVARWVGAFLLLFCSFSYSNAQETTPNLIGGTWNNVVNGTHPNNCCTGGPSPLYESSTNTIHFSYGLTAVHQVQAINQALSGSGVQINGWNWGYDLRNMNGLMGGQGGTDSIAVTSFMTNSAGQIIKQSDQHYNTQFDWTRFTGTELLTTPYSLANSGSLGIQFVSSDSGFWAGYYGPQVRNVSLTANYTVDQCAVNPQSSPTCPGFRTYYNMWDDGYAQVNLPFTFPFYGQQFTTSFMFTNGVVGFLNTNTWGFCCDGTNLYQQATSGSPSWNFGIYALNTDLYPGANSKFYTEQTHNGTGLKYTWENVTEIGTNLENTFSVNIRDTGWIGINYDKVNLSPWRNPLIGIAGDITKGQFSQYYFGPASGLPNLAGTTLNFTGTETTDLCTYNPLYNSSCPGYAEAYFNQQCSISPLYNTACPGYAQAYYTQQCNINALYDTGCPGYAAAYLNYQCSLDPLYSTTCQGYEQAYFNQQCSISGLYSTSCPNYQQAYFDQQCSLDGLYSTTCPNYKEAYAKSQLLNKKEEPVLVVAQATTTTSTTPALVADPVVNSVVTTTTTTTSPASSATAPVPLVSQPKQTETVAAVAAVKEEPKKEEAKKEESKQTATTATGSSEKKDEPKTARQQLQERREAAAKAKAVEEGKNLAENVGKAASMEQQVAVQNVVIQAMGYTPGFDAYNKAIIPDGVGYKPFTIYNNQKTIDNRAASRMFGGSDKLHEQMIDQQYGENYGR